MNKRKIWKRRMAGLLALIMVFSLFTGIAPKAEAADSNTITTTATIKVVNRVTSQTTRFSSGAILYLGPYGTSYDSTGALPSDMNAKLKVAYATGTRSDSYTNYAWSGCNSSYWTAVDVEKRDSKFDTCLQGCVYPYPNNTSGSFSYSCYASGYQGWNDGDKYNLYVEDATTATVTVTLSSSKKYHGNTTVALGDISNVNFQYTYGGKSFNRNITPSSIDSSNSTVGSVTNGVLDNTVAVNCGIATITIPIPNVYPTIYAGASSATAVTKTATASPSGNTEALLTDDDVKKKACQYSSNANYPAWGQYIKGLSYEVKYQPLQDWGTYETGSYTSLGNGLTRNQVGALLGHAGYYQVIASVTYNADAADVVRTYTYNVNVGRATLSVREPIDYLDTPAYIKNHRTQGYESYQGYDALLEYSYTPSAEQEDLRADADANDVQNLAWTVEMFKAVDKNDYNPSPLTGNKGRLVYKHHDLDANVTITNTGATTLYYGNTIPYAVTIDQEINYGKPVENEIWTYTLYDENEDPLGDAVTITDAEKADGKAIFSVSGLDVGTYSMKVEFTANYITTDEETMNVSGTKTIELNVVPRLVTWIPQTGVDKIYDGTAFAYDLEAGNVSVLSFEGSTSVLDNFLPDETDVVVTADGMYADADAGASKNINLTNLKLTGDHAYRYELTATTGTATGTISKADAQVTASDYFYLKQNLTTPDLKSGVVLVVKAIQLVKKDEDEALSVANGELREVEVEPGAVYALDASYIPTGLTIDTDGTILTPSTVTTNDYVANKDTIWPKVQLTLNDTNYNFTGRGKVFTVPYSVQGVIDYNVILNNMTGATITDAEWSAGSNESQWTGKYYYPAGRTLPVNVTKKGYTFKGWYDNASLTGEAVTKIDEGVEGKKTFYAKWEENIYDVEYVLGGGTNATDNPANYTVNTATVTLAAPTRTGYTFDGWYDVQNQPVTIIAGGEIGDITLTAKWTPIIYDISYDYKDGTEVDNPDTYTIETATITLKESTKTGYTFDGWYDAQGDKVESIAKGTTEDISLTAKWTLIDYTITYDLDGGTNATSNPATYTVVTEDITLAAPTRMGYTFDGWYDAEDNKVESITKGTTGNLTFTAKWTPITYQITYDLAGGTNAEENPDSYTVASEDITLLVATKKGYTFAGWYAGDDKVETIVKGTTGDISLTAQWTRVDYTISYDLDGGINATENPAGYTVESEKITLAAPTKRGYAFTGWYDGEQKVESIAKGSVGNLSLTAKWSLVDYTITYELGGGTNAEDNPATYTVVTEDITLAAPTRMGYNFTGWYADETEVECIVRGTTGNITLTAGWTPITYSISYDLNGGDITEDNPTFYTIEAETIILAEPVKTGYSFDGWYAEETKVESITKGSIGNLSLTAKWSLIDYTITYELGGGTNAEDNPATYTVVTEDITPATPTKNGYTFEGWYAGENKVDSITKGTTGDITLTASWIPITYKITYNLAGGSNAADNPAAYTVEDAVTLATPVKRNYDFAGWYDAAGNKVDKISVGSIGDITLTAHWTQKPVKLPVTDGTETPEYKIEGDTVVFLEPEKKGYEFEGWYDAAGNKVEKVDIEDADDVIVYPKWQEVTYTITYELGGGVNAPENPVSYTINTAAFTLLAPTKEGYDFVGWYTEAGKKKKTVAGGATGNITLFAKWTEQPPKDEVGQMEETIAETDTDKGDVKGAKFSDLKLIATGASKSVKLTWTKVTGAKGYIIYGAKCGSKMKQIATVKKSVTKYTIKNLKKGTYYKYVVAAYKTVDGEKKVLATSVTVHVTTAGGKYGNPKQVDNPNSGIWLNVKRSITLKPTMKVTKKIKLHTKKFRYESSNKKIAVVDKNGKITTKKAGVCYIYIYSQNGVYKQVKLTVVK